MTDKALFKYICKNAQTQNEMIEEKYIGMSPAAASAHNYIQGRLFSFLDNNIYEDEFTAYIEEPITDDRNDLTPDVIVKDDEIEEPAVIIEITTTRELNKQKERAEEYAKQFPNCEIFILDYERKKWFSFGPEADEDEPDYCELINENLDDSINWEKVQKLRK